MIVASGIDFSFGSRQILSKVDIAVQEKQFVSLLGPSGCGKSTLLRLLAGLLKPAKGKIEVNSRKTSGFVFQEPNLLSWLSLQENIDLPKKFSHKIDNDWQQYLLQICKLNEHTKLFPEQLSGGMKMRASLVRALGPKPEILFCDEPFAALDEVTRFELGDLLLEIKKEMPLTCVFVTHSISESVYLSDEIHLMSAAEKSIKRKVSISLGKRNFQLRSSPGYLELVGTTSDIFRELQ